MFPLELYPGPMMLTARLCRLKAGFGLVMMMMEVMVVIGMMVLTSKMIIMVKVMIIPHICHFFTRAKFLENEIYIEKRQFFALNL